MTSVHLYSHEGPVCFLLTLLPLQGDDELLAQRRWLQVSVLVRHYGDDPLPTIAHHMLNGCFHRLGSHGVL